MTNVRLQILCKKGAQNGRRLGLISLVLAVLGFGWCFMLPLSQAEQFSESPPTLEISEKQAILRAILSSIDQLEQEVRVKQEELRSPRAEGRREELIQEIKEIGNKLGELRRNFNEIASGVDPTIFSKSEEVEINWTKELKELLRPVINELRRLSARPREIDQLRTKIARYREQRLQVEKGLNNIQELAKQTSDPELVSHLLQLQEEWQAELQNINTQLSIATQQLDQKLGDKKSLSESLRDLFQLFFRSRGRNLLLACIAFVSFWLFFHQLQNLINRFIQRRLKKRTFSVRLFNVIYNCLTILGAILSFLAVLYFFGDWVLLTLSAMFLLGIVWNSRNALSRFWNQGMLLLNVGPVREGERIVYNGVPWLVRSLNFYTRLVNPELVGGEIRLPLHYLLEMHSRPFKPDEPWFPTREGDWVILSDQTFGKVILQTPEIVRLVLLGGSRKTYNTPDFLAQNPMVLSTGFRLSVQFGIDYQHQALITHDIPKKMERKLREELQHEGYGEDIEKITVEFAEAGASALNLQVDADFSGRVASSHWILSRAIQRICVDACNEYGWVIPFTQITLHMASSSQTDSLPPRDGSALQEEES